MLACGALLLTAATAQQQIPRNSLWSFYDKGVFSDVSWRSLTYNDATWATGVGPLGYGLTLAKTVIGFGPSSTRRFASAYFRKSFVASVPANASGNVTLWVMCDDGCGVFINGVLLGAKACLGVRGASVCVCVCLGGAERGVCVCGGCRAHTIAVA